MAYIKSQIRVIIFSKNVTSNLSFGEDWSSGKTIIARIPLSITFPFSSKLTAFLLYQWSGIGITAGAHRLWAHRSYKAKWPLQVLLVLLNTIAFQVSNKADFFGILLQTKSLSTHFLFLLLMILAVCMH